MNIKTDTDKKSSGTTQHEWRVLSSIMTQYPCGTWKRDVYMQDCRCVGNHFSNSRHRGFMHTSSSIQSHGRTCLLAAALPHQRCTQGNKADPTASNCSEIVKRICVSHRASIRVMPWPRQACKSLSRGQANISAPLTRRANAEVENCLRNVSLEPTQIRTAFNTQDCTSLVHHVDRRECCSIFLVMGTRATYGTKMNVLDGGGSLSQALSAVILLRAVCCRPMPRTKYVAFHIRIAKVGNATPHDHDRRTQSMEDIAGDVERVASQIRNKTHSTGS